MNLPLYNKLIQLHYDSTTLIESTNIFIRTQIQTFNDESKVMHSSIL